MLSRYSAMSFLWTYHPSIDLVLYKHFNLNFYKIKILSGGGGGKIPTLMQYPDSVLLVDIASIHK